MEATVDDFLNEINEIAPPKSSKQKDRSTMWQECYDDLTGFTYYWNTKTDQVTWDTPPELRSLKDDKKVSKITNLFIPPKRASLLPSTSSNMIDKSVKIYKISDSSKYIEKEEKIEKKTKIQPQKRLHKRYESEEKNIKSYKEESNYKTDEPNNKVMKHTNNENTKQKKQDSDSSNLSDDDDVDILTKMHKKVKELESNTCAITTKTEDQKDLKIKSSQKDKNTVSPKGLSLVAGYSDSDFSEDDEDKEVKSILPVNDLLQVPKVSHSTLFPITQPVDVKDFMKSPELEEKSSEEKPVTEFNSKAFQRKKRIGIALVNVGKRKEPDEEDPDNERKGFGYNKASEMPSKENVYVDFKKGGVIFVKSDALKPSAFQNEVKDLKEKKEEDKESEVDEMYSTLNEKLGFLSEGRPPVLPVQVMMIQAETLFTAIKDKALQITYLHKWLNETYSQLVKLEQEAAPDGWLLQWDRSNKRYYYRNQSTGESQWEYPQEDVNACDDAMDISTTPPPAEPTIDMSPPLPPTIRSPTPPPPPIISLESCSSVTRVPAHDEPLPPGVEPPELAQAQVASTKNISDPLNSALDSFYSDLATIENSCSPPLQHFHPDDVVSVDNQTATSDFGKKKKKSKVKLAPGLSMKKKGVSELVQKWKNVQQHYND